MARTKEETWSLTSADLTAMPNTTAYRNDGTANQWTDIWQYQVPSGQAHILKPSHFFSAYIEDDSPAVVGDGTCQVKIVIRDQSKQDEKAIYGPALYIDSKEFQDRDKMARLALQNDLAIEEKFWLVIMCKDDGVIDESDSYFDLQMVRVRSTI